MNLGHDPGAEPAACIPLDVLATWLAPEALARIERFFGPERKAAQVDTELAAVGLMAVWEHGVQGPALAEIRVGELGEGAAEGSP